MLLAASEEAASYGSNTFMIYTGAPQNTRRKKIEDLNIEAGQAHMKEHGMTDIVVHAPYIINIGNTVNPATFELGVDSFALRLSVRKRWEQDKLFSTRVRMSEQEQRQGFKKSLKV